MIEKSLSYLCLALLLFAAGWWSAVNQDQFWARAGRVGEYASRAIDRTPTCDKTYYVCDPLPSPSPTP